MENKEADQKLGNGTWVSKPKKIFTHVHCIYKCILHFCQCNENCIVFVPPDENFSFVGVHTKRNRAMGEGRQIGSAPSPLPEGVSVFTHDPSVLLLLLLLVSPIN